MGENVDFNTTPAELRSEVANVNIHAAGFLATKRSVGAGVNGEDGEGGKLHDISQSVLGEGFEPS